MRVFFVIITFLGSAVFSQAGQPGWERASELFERYCFTCHDSDTGKGDVILDGIYDTDGKITDYKLWVKALDSVAANEMPPKKKKTQPTPEERKEITDWIEAALNRSAMANAGDPGMVTMRRLTNAEYRHTLRDLTGIAKNYSEGFAADGGGGEGFSNTGDVLFVSPEQLEKYLKSAREIANHASILPGTGITFHKNPVGTRGPDLLLSQTEQALRKWYRKHAETLIPKDDDLREGDYLTACWKWKYREKTGAASLETLASEAGLNIHFLNNWWAILSSNGDNSRYLKLTTDAFHALPGPESGDAPEKIQAIVAQRKAWTTTHNGDWTHAQRLQQDADGVRTYTTKIELKGEQKVHLLVTDVGDGNEGDIVYWSELRFQWPDGNWDNLFAWMWRTGKAAQDEATKKWFHQYSRLEMKHPTGREMKKQTFAVKAPSIITFPVPEGTLAFSAKGQLEQDAPNKEKASVQWQVVAGQRPKKLPAVLPGVVTIWHRLTPTHRKLSNEFNLMKKRFPADFDKRVFEVENNVWRWDNTVEGAYYLSNEQLYSLLPESESRFAKRTKMDLGYVAPKTVSKAVASNWANHLLDDLAQFAAKAWRRPVSQQEKDTFRKIYQAARAAEMTREDAAREALVSILVSPHFLFKVEKGTEEKENRLSQYEYASRLSYLMWSSMPDEALLKSAREGKLFEWQVVCDHVDRMIGDWKSLALAQEFGGQWLGFHDLHSLKSIDRKTFPEFTPALRHLMYEESWRFLFDLIRNHRPVTDIVQAGYTLLNEPLATHYGIPGVTGKEFRYIDVAEHRRGGILGMAGFHAKTSYPVRTSPVLRGNWILKEVLGRPTPPPPPNVLNSKKVRARHP